MIFIQALRKNDINPEGGKQVEFGKSFFQDFSWEVNSVHEILIHCDHDTIKTSLKVRGSERGGDRLGADCKEYANENGEFPLKDYLIYKKRFTVEHVGNIFMVFESKDNTGNEFNLYFTPLRDSLKITDFINMIKTGDFTREDVKFLFKTYLNHCVSSQVTKEPLQESSIKQILDHLEVDYVYEFVPSLKGDLESFYDILDPDRVLNILSELRSTPEFDNNDLRRFRQGSLSHYATFLRNLRFFGKFEKSGNKAQDTQHADELPLQQIFYGAPGTGKSHEITKQTKGCAVVRTTFHPDSDYSTFVGAYKPTMANVRKSVVIGQDEKEVRPLAGNSEFESRIQYSFVKQAFLKAYLGAWRKYAESRMTQMPTDPEPQYLVIEEINRGNCAQIFGDIFQLLDREDNGFSSYPIEADTDLQQEIARAFSEEEEYMIHKLDVDNAVEDYTSNYGATLSEDIINGRVMLLPPNMYIWATMNTSDQSLFPIDSAFKRRWDWTYMPIDTEKEQWYISVDGIKYSWSSFLEQINNEIQETTSSEDKQLGFYFCKAENGEIKVGKFVSKVLFYLYNDVFKDYGLEREFFKDKENSNEIITFRSLYKGVNEINTLQVKKLLDNLKVDNDSKKEEVTEEQTGKPV